MELSITFKRRLYNRWIILVGTLAIGIGAAGALYWFFFRGLKFINPGSPADTYGTAFNGIVGTSITIIGLAFLIYAYRGQKQQAEYELINRLYESLLEDINSIQYRKKYDKKSSAPTNGQLLQGVEALYKYEADDDTNQNSVLIHLNLILLTFEQIISLVDCSIAVS